jgi:hypothetical protein
VLPTLPPAKAVGVASALIAMATATVQADMRATFMETSCQPGVPPGAPIVLASC